MKRSCGVFVLCAVMPWVAVAGETSSHFTVTAYVPPRASLERIVHPARFAVSARDIARGYLDLAAVYRVSSNDPAGYVVRLAPRIGLTRSIEVSGLATPVVMGDEVVEVSQPSALRPQELSLNFRLLLDEAAVPGTYDLPVHVVVGAL
jgi:hypothetical protein